MILSTGELICGPNKGTRLAAQVYLLYKYNFRIGRMCRVGQKVNGEKSLIALSFFSPSEENAAALAKSQDYSVFRNSISLMNPSASEQLAQFFGKEIFPFFMPDENDNATRYIKLYNERGQFHDSVPPSRRLQLPSVTNLPFSSSKQN